MVHPESHAAGEHEHAIAVLEEVRDNAIQKVEALNGEHRDVLDAAEVARREIADQQSMVDQYEYAIRALSTPARSDAGRPAPRPIRDNPQA